MKWAAELDMVWEKLMYVKGVCFLDAILEYDNGKCYSFGTLGFCFDWWDDMFCLFTCYGNGY